MRKNGLPWLVATMLWVLVFCTSQSVSAQVPSTVDTMRILDAIGGVGDTVMVEFYMANVDTVGGYVFRVVFDPTLIEPLTDTVIDGSDTYYYIEPVQLRGTPFEEFNGGVLPAQGVMAFVAVDYDADTTDLFLPGSGVAMQMPWRVKPSAVPQTTTIAFENDPNFPQSFNTLTDLQGIILKRPVLVTGVFTIDGEACDCPFQSDSDLDGFITSLDLARIIDILFAGSPSPQEPLCLSPRFDFDCDGFVTALDLGQLIDHLFAGGVGPCDPCSQP